MQKPIHNLFCGTFDEMYEQEFGRLVTKASESDQYDETLFWAFVKMRQNAWARRAMGMPKPWTGDPIINEWRFTNIYRELDRGTLYLIENVLEKAPTHQIAITMSALYRCFNRPETWERLKEYAKSEGYDAENLENMYDFYFTTNHAYLYKFFQRYHNHKDFKLFTGAYQMTSMVKMFYDFSIDKLANAAFDTIHNMEEPDIKRITERFALVPYLGMFSAFQIAMDICIPTLANNSKPWVNVKKDALDSWCAVGPGSKAGAALIRNDINATTIIRYLRENQFLRLGMLGGDPFPYPIRNGEPQHLRIIDIEHALCEYAKYCNALKGGRMKSRLATLTKETTWKPTSPIPLSWGDAYAR